MEGAPAAAWLESDSNSVESHRFALPMEGPIILGREDKCHLRISDAGVSRRHAEIQWTGASFILKDLESATGTMVNGQAIRQMEIKDGDSILLGGSLFTYHGPPRLEKPSGSPRVQCEHCGRWLKPGMSLCPGCGSPAP